MNARLVALTLLVPAVAHADVTDTVVAFSYVIPMGVGAIATAVNGTYLAYDEPAPREWRWIGWIAGGIDVAWGAGLLAAEHDRTEGIALGSLALGVGAAAVLTATFVREDRARLGVVPVASASSAGLVVAGRF